MGARKRSDRFFVYNRIVKALKIEPGLTSWQLSQRFGPRHDLFTKARAELKIEDPKNEYLTEEDMRKAKPVDKSINRITFGGHYRR